MCFNLKKIRNLFDQFSNNQIIERKNTFLLIRERSRSALGNLNLNNFLKSNFFSKQNTNIQNRTNNKLTLSARYTNPCQIIITF